MKATRIKLYYTALVGGDECKSPRRQAFEKQAIVFKNGDEDGGVVFVAGRRGQKAEFFEIEDGRPKRNGASSFDYDGLFNAESSEIVEELSLTDEQIALALSILPARSSHEKLIAECLKLLST